MKYSLRFLFGALLLGGPPVASAGDATIAVVIPARPPSRPAHFNWVFTSGNGQAPLVGQFACGSYWVAPADGDTGVTFVALTGEPARQDLLSCDADPLTERHGMLSGKNRYGSHDASENVLPQLPITYAPAADSCVSLVAAMQRDEAATSKGGTRQIVGEVADAYCVVTVLPGAPPGGGGGMIRPNITGVHKEFLTWQDFDLDRLPGHAFIPGRSEDAWASTALRWRHSTEIFGMAAEVPTARRGLQFTKFSEGGRAFRAHLLIPDYGSGMARQFNSDLLAMFSPASTLAQKKPALAAMLAFGLDIYHARYDRAGRARTRWSSGAGQSPGQFLPAVFAAALLRDTTKARHLQLAAITNHGTDPGEFGPQELRQIKRGVTGVLLWGDGQPINRGGNRMVEQDWRYWADFTSSKCYDGYEGKGDPNKGQKGAADPYGFIDGPANCPGAAYMSVSMGPFRSFAAAMILMPRIRCIVNSDAPVEYVDRVTRHGLWAWPDPVAAPARSDRETARTWWGVEGCSEWGRTWGVRTNDVRFAIEDGKGRFRSRHGMPLGSGGYESAVAHDNWAAIIALYDGATFEESAVDVGVVVAPEILFSHIDRPRAHLFCATPDATIHYTLDGRPPSPASPVYQGPSLPLDSSAVVVRACAVREGMRPSAVRSRSPSVALLK